MQASLFQVRFSKGEARLLEHEKHGATLQAHTTELALIQFLLLGSEQARKSLIQQEEGMTQPSDKTNPEVSIQDVTRDMGDRLKSKARETVDEVREHAGTFGETQRDQFAEGVSEASSAFRKAAEDMNGGSPQERIISQIATSLADASDAIRDRDLSQIAGDLSAFARRNPLAYLGAAVGLGVATARFAKASGPVASTASKRPVRSAGDVGGAAGSDTPTTGVASERDAFSATAADREGL
ncbi:hypothetical protein [Salipiger sp. PrR007]|uniref:hypothetical protein n=1 Tax=Salipiger sp. PrR007 TaxID=2706884 RepID=UPI0013B64002|nr:hypothetical protein [Salipiger sp. PrR007]NDW32742.1 hypothetical protein [Salipiger sp. PrR007]